MAEATRYMLEFKEIASDIVRKLDIQEGFWGICIEFGLGAQNIPTGPDGKVLVPAALTIVQKIGIQRFSEPNSLTVDAAEINPRSTKREKRSGKRATTAEQARK